MPKDAIVKPAEPLGRKLYRRSFETDYPVRRRGIRILYRNLCSANMGSTLTPEQTVIGIDDVERADCKVL